MRKRRWRGCACYIVAPPKRCRRGRLPTVMRLRQSKRRTLPIVGHGGEEAHAESITNVRAIIRVRSLPIVMPVEHYSAALSLGDSDAALLHTNIGDAQTLLGDYDAALASYETSAAFGAATANANLARVYLRRGDWERAARHLENALETTQDPRRRHSRM